MATIVKIKFNGGKDECYALKNRDKYVPIFVEELATAEFKNVVCETEVELDIFGRLVVK